MEICGKCGEHEPLVIGESASEFATCRDREQEPVS
jgi:hypothetical protein